MIEKGLSSKLWRLSKSIVEKVNEYKESGEAIKTKRLYIKPKVDNFDYKEGNISYGTSFNYIEKEEWHWKDQFDFIERVIKQLSKYKEIVSELSRKYKVNESQADFWLSRFVQILIPRILEGVTDEILVDHITSFIGDLVKSPVEWKLKIWIDGVWLEKNGYEIYEGLNIRRPIPSDLEAESPFDLVPMVPAPGFRETSAAILELTYRSREQKEMYDEVDIILNCLRLFRLGSVFSVKTEMHPKSFLTFGGTSTPNLRFSPTYKYCISGQDISKLKDLIERIKTLLPKRSSQVVSGEIDPIVISIQRYNDALLKPESIESRITSAITCFEALYLKAKERMELSHRLSQRASALLRLFDFTPLEVYNTLIQAYDIRSTFIHGSQIKPEEHRNAAKLAEKTLEYARVSLLVFLQLKQLIDKEKFISKIDNSLLDEGAHSKLKGFVKENCAIYRE